MRILAILKAAFMGSTSRWNRMGCAICLLFASGLAWGQGDRPRIGLALSGGGARGAAHVGVLKVLDSMRIPVDCIAGTSMGAVVGGAFAAGNSPEEMEALIAKTDWADVFTDRPPRAEVSARRKADDYKPLFAPEFGVGPGGMKLPRGAVAGVTVEGFLRNLAAPAVALDDFDHLPIPYRAVAADIATGQAVILSKGNLMSAMRASMAVPGALAPVERDGRLLVDGGIANNLPIELVRSLCADVVIAVNISTPPFNREEITSALSVVGQLISLLGKETVDRQLASMRAHDILITPELGDISAGSFERQLEAIEKGMEATRKAGAFLQRYALPEVEYAQWRSTRARSGPVLGMVDSVEIDGVARTNADVLGALINTQSGMQLSATQLNADLRRVFGRGDFDAVDYRIVDEAINKRKLVVSVHEKDTGPDYLRFGLGFSTNFNGDAGFNALASYRRTWLNSLGGEWLTEVQAGEHTYVSSEFYQPLHRRGQWFIAPYVQWGQVRRDLFDDGNRIASYRIRESRVGADVGRVLGTWGEVRLGPVARQAEASLAVGDPLLPNVSGSVSGVRLRTVGDTLDSPWFPRTGHRVVANLFANTTGARYRRLEASWTGAYSTGEHSVAMTAYGGTALSGRIPVYDAFSLGGPLKLSAYRNGQFSGERATLVSLRYYHRQLRLPSIIGSGVYLGGSLEAGRIDRRFGTSETTGRLWSSSVFLAAETFFGPMFFGVAFGPNSTRSLYLIVVSSTF